MKEKNRIEPKLYYKITITLNLEGLREETEVYLVYIFESYTIDLWDQKVMVFILGGCFHFDSYVLYHLI